MANQVCIIETDKIVNGSNLMKGNTNLTSWTSDSSSITNGSSMFEGCNNLMYFSASLPALYDGTKMFKNCGTDADAARSRYFEFTPSISNIKIMTEMFANTYGSGMIGSLPEFRWSPVDVPQGVTNVDNMINGRYIIGNTLEWITRLLEFSNISVSQNLGKIQTSEEENIRTYLENLGWTFVSETDSSKEPDGVDLKMSYTVPSGVLVYITVYYMGTHN